MFLAIDIGNSNIVLGLYNQGFLMHKWRIISNLQKTEDDYAIDIIELFLTNKVDCLLIERCLIASVVPILGDAVEGAIKKFLDAEKIFIIGKNIKINIDIQLENKKEVGVDRLINSVAGYNECGGNLIIIDFGTATTFDVVGKNGEYLGGIIAAGINLSLKTLHQATAQLPMIEIKKQKNVVGKNTIQAMNSGAYFGYLSLITGLVDKIEKELSLENKMTKIITGGLAELFKDDLPNYHLRENLTLDGILQIGSNAFFPK